MTFSSNFKNWHQSSLDNSNENEGVVPASSSRPLSLIATIHVSCLKEIIRQTIKEELHIFLKDMYDMNM